jgi:PAS domain S-box-containing protein
VRAGLSRADISGAPHRGPDVPGRDHGRGDVTADVRAPDGGSVPPEVVAAVFHTAAVSDGLAFLVVERHGGTARPIWGNTGAVHLLGYALEDLRRLGVQQLFPTLRGGELDLLLRRERTARMTLPVRSASGALVETTVRATPSPGGTTWTLQLDGGPAGARERALGATADAYEGRFTTLTDRSPVPTLLSDQGLRLASVNDAFCALVGRPAEELLGTGWTAAVHPDDLDDLVERVAGVLEGGDAEFRCRLVRADGVVRTTVLRLTHLSAPGAGAGFVGTVEDVTARLALEAELRRPAPPLHSHRELTA